MDFTTNYCGAYWSDGKFQSSVANGKSTPVSGLDAACQEHDASYATARSGVELDAADDKFHTRAQKFGFRGKLYGNAVKHVNKFTRHTMPSWYNAITDKFYSREIANAKLAAKRDADRGKLNLRQVDPDGATHPVSVRPVEDVSLGGTVYGPSVPPGSGEPEGHAWGFSNLPMNYSVHNWPRQKIENNKNRIVPTHPLKNKKQNKRFHLTQEQKIQALPFIFPPRNKLQKNKIAPQVQSSQTKKNTKHGKAGGTKECPCSKG